MVATVIIHCYNEEFLLPYWLKHHREIFDHGIIIDYASTDLSVAIAQDLVPDWDILQSRNPDFDAAACDAEVMDIEASVGEWKMVLTTTEFFCTRDMSTFIQSIDDQGKHAAKIRPVAMVDTHEHVGLNENEPLIDQCHFGFFDGYMAPYKSRLLHRHGNGAYTVGRHDTGHADVLLNPPGALLAWFGWAPWTPELRKRKLQIQHRIPEADKKAGKGVQHILDEASLDAAWREQVGRSEDLRQLEEFTAVIG